MAKSAKEISLFNELLKEISKNNDGINFIIADKFLTEMKDLISKNKSEQKSILDQTLKILRELRTYRELIADKVGKHEKLRNKPKEITKDIYSLHICKKNINYRYLCIIEEDKIYLLVAFNEREGKGSTNYDGKAKLAYQRYLDLIRRDHNE